MIAKQEEFLHMYHITIILSVMLSEPVKHFNLDSGLAVKSLLVTYYLQSNKSFCLVIECLYDLTERPFA
jgi:hypothetical protein